MKQFATITVIGRDKTGVIARFTHFLFQRGANIEALEEQVTRGEFSMILQVSWSGRRINEPDLRKELAELGLTLGMEVGVHFTDPRRPQRMAILVTREAHCLKAILREVKRGKLKATPVVVISNRTDLQPMAKASGLPFHPVPWDGDRLSAEQTALGILREH